MNQYYAIKAPDGSYDAIRQSAQSAKMKWTKSNRTNTYAYGRAEWKCWENLGYRCVRVEIKEIV